MQTDAEAELICRACGNPLRLETMSSRCSRCNYINFRFNGAEHLFGWLTSEHAGASVESLFREQFNRACELVAKDLAGATSLLIHSMARREALLAQSQAPRSLMRDGHSGIYNLAVQLLYLLVCERGGVRLHSLPEETGLEADRPDELWQRIYDAALLATRWLKVASGQATYTINGNTLIERITENYQLELETQENSHLVEAKFRNKYRILEESELYKIQKLVLGFSTKDYHALIADKFSGLRELTTIQERGPIIAAKLDDAGRFAGMLLEALTLNLHRVLHFQYPYYFDMGTMRDGPRPLELPIETIALNWTSYYPFYEAQTDDNGRVVLFSKHVLVNALSYMLTSRSHMAAALVKRVANIDTPEAAVVRGYQDKVSARLEQRIEERLRAARFSTKANLKNLRGLPAKEIDVVGARICKKVTLIVLVEAKDLDMPLHKPRSFSIALGDLRRGAEQQLTPQTDWVRNEWKSLLELLGVKPTNRVVVSPLLVTRRYMAPNLIPGCTLIPLNMLDLVLARLAHGNLEPKDGLGPLPRIVLYPNA